MKYIVGGEQSGDFLYFSTAPELPRTGVRQRERTDLPNLLSSESPHQQSASQEPLFLFPDTITPQRHLCELNSSSIFVECPLSLYSSFRPVLDKSNILGGD